MTGRLVPAVATAHFQHEGRPLRPGAEFETTESELDDLRVLGFAQRAPTRPARAVYETRVMVAETSPPAVSHEPPPVADDAHKAPPARKRRYRNRVMRAES